ncbi:uncharacterized protein PHALS_13728 [Plasmopara halstedii]|uniref:Uncharacterized protein n=1 Tax=Plasmopara halstedii TaxID=4781 RepID=A0A0P1AQL1_PLAHL|nr:uncharacterized protein PHALS_13728 [Plasmopara halstedii]CEG43536.1 hypothetical protein PHALS_13728 [Plasmopara halstedii]|eukprot:XP_024579905.1 hypothetical protein PHALS_13728 [Plasmopara halstedii]
MAMNFASYTQSFFARAIIKEKVVLKNAHRDGISVLKYYINEKSGKIRLKAVAALFL